MACWHCPAQKWGPPLTLGGTYSPTAAPHPNSIIKCKLVLVCAQIPSGCSSCGCQKLLAIRWQSIAIHGFIRVLN
jgi:hypothetical protein